MPTVPRLREATRRHPPGLALERALWEDGRRYVVGLDEVGRGAWAGPVSVGAAIVPLDRRIYKVRDSKLLNEAEREAMFGRIADWVEAWSVGHASEAECDELGMADAQRLAARRAIERLPITPDAFLIDGNWDFVGLPGTRTVVGGDRISLTIASASILAKVTRDRIMRRVDPMFPAYNFASNKGYPCPVHRASIAAWGPTAIHRRSWVFMDTMAWGLPRYRRAEQLSFEWT